MCQGDTSIVGKNQNTKLHNISKEKSGEGNYSETNKNNKRVPSSFSLAEYADFALQSIKNYLETRAKM